MKSTSKTVESVQHLALVRLSSEDWLVWRSLRLQALKDAPYAFGSKLADWQGEGDLETRWRERLDSVSLNLVAFLDGTPIGMVSGIEADQNATVELISLWVAPLARGHGVGDALIEAVTLWATQLKADLLSLEVTEANEYAPQLYLRHGFIEQEKRVPDSPMEIPERRFLKKLTV